MQQSHHDDQRLETYRVRITGKVQGVGYRHATVRQAHALKITGWVMNVHAGAVEAVIQGGVDQIDRMLQWMRVGPPAARVAEVDTTELATDRRYKHFEQR